jgi:hypothetical protein
MVADVVSHTWLRGVGPDRLSLMGENGEKIDFFRVLL